MATSFAFIHGFGNKDNSFTQCILINVAGLNSSLWRSCTYSYIFKELGHKIRAIALPLQNPWGIWTCCTSTSMTLDIFVFSPIFVFRVFFLWSSQQLHWISRWEIRSDNFNTRTKSRENLTKTHVNSHNSNSELYEWTLIFGPTFDLWETVCLQRLIVFLFRKKDGSCI